MGLVTCDFEDDLDVSLGILLMPEEDVEDGDEFWLTIGDIRIESFSSELSVTISWDEGTFTVSIYGDFSDPDAELTGSFDTTNGDMPLREALRMAVADLQEFPY